MHDDAPHRSNLNFFFVLDAILSTTSLKEAAARVNLSPPAISMALRKARDHYRDELVIEIEGRRQLTALAVALQPRIRRTLLDARRILDLTLDFDPATASTAIRITMPDFVEVLYLPHVLRKMRALAPGVALHLVPFDYRPAARQFDRDVDFAILPGMLIDRTLGYRRLYSEQLGVMVDTSHPLAERGKITVEQYAAGSHAVLFDTVDMLAPATGEAADLLARRTVVARTATYAALPRMALGTDLIVTASNRYAHFCASIMTLAPIGFPLPVDEVEVAVQWHPSRDREPMIDWFVDLLVEMVVSV